LKKKRRRIKITQENFKEKFFEAVEESVKIAKCSPGQVWYDAHLDLLILFFCVDGNGGWFKFSTMYAYYSNDEIAENCFYIGEFD